MATRHPVTREVTRADIEWMLDVLAEEIAVRRAREQVLLLPLYERLENEAADMKAMDDTRSRALERAKRLSG